MKFLIGQKVNMTQIFADNGVVTPVTVIKAEPMVVTQVKTSEKDGYTALQFGYGTQKASRIAKPQMGHFKNLGPFKGTKEFRLSFEQQRAEAMPVMAVGDSVAVTAFAVGDTIEVSGTSKGKGFQGVVKRHGFGGGRRTHGQKHSEREPGSIGGGGRAGGRVAKGMRMAGRMGSDRVTVKNLRVMGIDEAAGTILVAGAVPGRRGTLIEIRG